MLIGPEPFTEEADDIIKAAVQRYQEIFRKLFVQYID